jgi:D-serine deaminase-like pyridoxal phosphate-dependent protein
MTWFHIDNADELASPTILIFPDRIKDNICTMVEMVGGDPSRLRPHIKTYKMREVIRMQLEVGISAFKCSTIAELELAATAGAQDLLLAIQPVGPNIRRLLKLVELFPSVKFSSLVDDHANLERISKIFSEAAKSLPLFVDVDCGMKRSGIKPSEDAVRLCQAIIEVPSVEFAGLHVYDGHVHDTDQTSRQEQYASSWATVEPFIERLEDLGVEIPFLIGGGSPSFPFHAEACIRNDKRYRYQCSPGKWRSSLCNAW